jgi:hypothetical protein
VFGYAQEFSIRLCEICHSMWEMRFVVSLLAPPRATILLPWAVTRRVQVLGVSKRRLGGSDVNEDGEGEGEGEGEGDGDGDEGRERERSVRVCDWE